jgi:hypothetical protein
MKENSIKSKGKYDKAKQSFVYDEMTRFEEKININSKLFYEKLISCEAEQLRYDHLSKFL